MRQLIVFYRAILGLFFLYFRLFNTVDSKYSILIFANDWIRTTDLWNGKQPLYQLSHNHVQLILFTAMFS